MPECDYRYDKGVEIEVRDGEDGGDPVVEGIGVIYDRETELWPGFFETVKRGAFDSTLHSQSGREVKSFVNHDANAPLSTTRSKPKLVLVETDKGLRFRSPIPPTSYGEDLKINLKRGNIRGASFSFSVEKNGDTLTFDEKGRAHRTITKARLYEIGPVTNPAYPQTKVGLRSAEDAAREYGEQYKERQAAARAKAQAEQDLRERQLYLLERSATNG